MKKSKFLIIFAFLLGLATIFSMPSLNSKKAYASETYIEISSYEQLSLIGNDASFPLTSNYKLSADIDFVNVNNFLPIGLKIEDGEININAFKGIFDGNGFKIKNFKLKQSEAFYHYGLFSLIENATIKNLAIENITIKNDLVFNEDVSNSNSVYIGGISALSVNSIIENSQAIFSNLEVSLKSSNGLVYFGGITAKASAGSVIKNTYSKHNLSFILSNELMADFSFGGVAGVLDSSFIHNVISTSTLKVETFNKFGFSSILFLNSGGVAGFVSGSSSKIISTYSQFFSNVSYLEQSKNNLGAVIGTVSSALVPNVDNISYNHFFAKQVNNLLQEVALNVAIGKKSYYNDSTSKYYPYQENAFEAFIDKNKWAPNPYEWNNEKVWIINRVELPTLQVFNKYNVALKIQDTKISLTEGVSPSLILSMQFVNTNNVLESTLDAKYGQKVNVLVALINDYDKFYELLSVQLDGKVITKSADFTFRQLTEEDTDYNISQFETTRVYLIEFYVSNTLKGDVSVALEKIKFDLTVETEDSQMGLVKRKTSSVTTSSFVQVVSAANIYEFVAETNNTFAFSKWIMIVPVQSTDNQQTETEEVVELGEYSNYAQINFSFGATGNQDITQAILKGGKLVATFTNNVARTTLKIEDKEKGVSQDSGFITYIQDGEVIDISLPIAYEKNKTQTLIANAKPGFKFVGWYDNANRLISSGATYELTPQDYDDELVLRAVFEKDGQGSSNTLVWIIVGSVVGAFVIGLVIFIIIKKRSDNSYRNFY